MFVITISLMARSRLEAIASRLEAILTPAINLLRSEVDAFLHQGLCSVRSVLVPSRKARSY